MQRPTTAASTLPSHLVRRSAAKRASHVRDRPAQRRPVVPPADLYVAKHILHDWSDDQCRTLLGNISRSAKPGARVLVIEMVIPEDGSPSAAPLMDLNMLVVLPGRERTARQYGSSSRR